MVCMRPERSKLQPLFLEAGALQPRNPPHYTLIPACAMSWYVACLIWCGLIWTVAYAFSRTQSAPKLVSYLRPHLEQSCVRISSYAVGASGAALDSNLACAIPRTQLAPHLARPHLDSNMRAPLTPTMYENPRTGTRCVPLARLKG